MARLEQRSGIAAGVISKRAQRTGCFTVAVAGFMRHVRFSQLDFAPYLNVREADFMSCMMATAFALLSPSPLPEVGRLASPR